MASDDGIDDRVAVCLGSQGNNGIDDGVAVRLVVALGGGGEGIGTDAVRSAAPMMIRLVVVSTMASPFVFALPVSPFVFGRAGWLLLLGWHAKVASPHAKVAFPFGRRRRWRGLYFFSSGVTCQGGIALWFGWLLHVKERKHHHMTPSQLQQSRVEYQPFSAKKFKHHIYQAVRREKFIN